MTDIPDITISTDGSCLGNPGPGGWSAVLRFGEHKREISGGYGPTTNNRMELFAAIHALEAVKRRARITIRTDSGYVVDSVMKGYAAKWRLKGYVGKKNGDLWDRLLDLIAKHERVTFAHVPGHAGDLDNERCHVLAQTQAYRLDLPPDPGYTVRKVEAIGEELFPDE